MESSKRLPQAGPGTQSIGAGKPLVESYPNSEKISLGELAVPARRIQLSDGEPPFTVYDTSGPQGGDPRLGLPKRRATWRACTTSAAERRSSTSRRSDVIVLRVGQVDVQDRKSVV